LAVHHSFPHRLRHLSLQFTRESPSILHWPHQNQTIISILINNFDIHNKSIQFPKQKEDQSLFYIISSITEWVGANQQSTQQIVFL